MSRKLLLQFSAGDQLFAIDSQRIIEIIPLVNLTQVPTAAEFISGIYNYRGKLIPVLDMSQLLFKQPAQERICTRIIITEYDTNDSKYLTGIVAEKVNQTLSLDTESVCEHNLANDKSSYIRQIFRHDNKNIQLIDINDLIPAKIVQLEQAISH